MTVSYPPIDTAAYLDLDDDAVDAALSRRGLERDGHVLFLSRVARAKGVLDLIDAYAASRAGRGAAGDRRRRERAGRGAGAGGR
jgi:glycogen(starch) synthase